MSRYVEAVRVPFSSGLEVKVALARMTVPYPNDPDASVFASAPKRNFIDEINLQQLETLKLPPSPRCDDEAFLRRATIDTIGRLPSVEERDRYLSESSESRRDALIERLLSSDDFVDYWTYRWCDVLLINGTRLRPVAVKSYYQWVHDAVRENLPWDRMVREILTATGGKRHQRSDQLLCFASEPRGDDRECLPGVSGSIDRLRQMPQPSPGKVDE